MYRIIIIILLFISTFAQAQNQMPDRWNMNLIAETELSGEYYGVKVRGDIAYCANLWGLVLFDISNPEEPEVIHRIPTPGNARKLYIRDNLLYLCDGYAGLRIYSIEDPDNPVEIGVCPDPPNAWDLDVQGDYAYITNYRSFRVCIIDVSDPTNPVQVSIIRSGVVIQIKVSGDYAYC